MTDWSEATPQRHGQAWVRRGSDDTAVYNPDDGRLHLLNPSALAIWELCDGRTSVSEMAAAVSELTDLSFEHADTDIRTTIGKLFELGLLAAD